MIVDKPEWVTHGTNIFSVDVHPQGTRFATAAADNRVKIWNMLPVIDVNQETDKSAPKLLATLADHFSAVNVARFSRSGRFLASGADDKLVCIYELRPGPGGRAFGSSDVPNVENWKHVSTLKGHTNNVLDVAWSPEDRWLATASVDNTIAIWDGATGARITTLEGHTSYVKTLAWDPVGTYLASQSDDKSCLMWRTQDWAQAGAVTEPFKRWVSLTFSLKMDWAPDGRALAVVNSFQSPNHTCVLLERGCWDRDPGPLTSLVGHTAAVLVARYSPRMFRVNGQLRPCLALGSQDKRLTVWLGQARPVYVGSRFFRAGVVDIAWAPDGLTILAASTDGTVALLQFKESDLAPLATPEEMEEHMQATYGDRKARTTVFAESAAQLALEAQAAETEAAASKRPSAALDARMGPGGEEAALVPAPAATTTQKRRIEPMVTNGHADSSQAASGPAAKRIRPDAVAALPLAARTAPPTGGSSAGQMPPPRPKPPPLPAAQRAARPGELPPPGRTAAPRATPPAAVGSTSAPAPAAIAAAAAPRLPVPEMFPVLSLPLGKEPNLMAGAPQRAAEVTNRKGAGGRTTARVSVAAGPRRLWADELPSAALAAAGTLHFLAVALADGNLQVWSAGGRRVLPAIQLGAAPAFLAAHGWRLLAAAADGALWVWDLQAPAVQLRASAAPLLAMAPARVVGMQLSAAGLPVAVMSDGAAHAYSTGMAAWMRVADGAFPASPFHSLLQGPSGELAQLQRAAGNAAAGQRRGAIMGSLAGGDAAGGSAGRAHLEANMAAALALQSPAEYKRWLITYVRHLSAEADEVRLREVCAELLGPLHHSGASPTTAGAATSATAMSAAATTAGVSGGTAGRAAQLQRQHGWQPRVLGLDKRAVLRGQVLRDIGRNRANQRLVNEFTELLAQLPPHPGEAQKL